MQAVQLNVWKSPPEMRDVHDLDPGPTAEGRLDDLLEVSRALVAPTPIQIQERPRISQSTASRFMRVLQRAELVESTWIGRWTFYCRKEARTAALPELPGTSL